MKKYQLAKPYIGAEEKEAVCSVLSSGVLSLGPITLKFEKQFAKRIGTRYACAVSSGTAGLHLALLAAGIGPGDEIITTPFSFIASANAILYTGASPVFVDVDSETGNIDTKKIEKRITRRTKAILVVHIFGHPAEMSDVMRIAKKHKLKVIEDACEALGAIHRDRNVGTFGESAVFAFYANKQITTGEGGMIVTNKKGIYRMCLSMRNQGRSSDMQWLEHERLGFNYRMDEMSAALGVTQLGRIHYILRERARIAQLYEKNLRPFQDYVIVPQTLKNNTRSWFVYTVRLKGNVSHRNAIIQRIGKMGISTKPYLPSIHLSEFYRKTFRYKSNMFPVSELVSASSIALPFYIGLTNSDIRYIVSKLILAIKSFQK